MLAPEQMIAAVHAYIDAFNAADAGAAAAIFADDAEIEDPVGSKPHSGHSAIRAFYEQSMRTGARLTLTGPLRVAAAHIAFPMQVRLNWQDRDLVIDVIDTFAFDASGKVRRMQAYFGPSNTADVTQENDNA